MVYNDINFNIEVFVSIIGYKNFTFNLNSIGTNSIQNVEMCITSDFFQKYIKNEETGEIIENLEYK